MGGDRGRTLPALHVPSLRRNLVGTPRPGDAHSRTLGWLGKEGGTSRQDADDVGASGHAHRDGRDAPRDGRVDGLGGTSDGRPAGPGPSTRPRPASHRTRGGGHRKRTGELLGDTGVEGRVRPRQPLRATNPRPASGGLAPPAVSQTNTETGETGCPTMGFTGGLRG